MKYVAIGFALVFVPGVPVGLAREVRGRVRARFADLRRDRHAALYVVIEGYRSVARNSPTVILHIS